jgi:light-regulated signal transduction histidine kinase (bacteriophytochrome)
MKIPVVDENPTASQLLRRVSELEDRNRELARRAEQLEQTRENLERANQELNARVQQRTAELNVANQELQSFSFSVAHDLRAPLRHISGFTNILLQDCAGQLDADNLKHLQSVNAATRMMGELIEALLKLSAVTRAEIHRSAVDLSALAGEVFAELQQKNPSRMVKFGLTPNMMAQGDKRLLRIVLVNLLGNAWKYSQKRVDAQIEFGKSSGEAEASYFVRDNGAGFDMARADKLFGAFQRLHSNADFEGIGIGLAAVQRIIRRHNGKIWAKSILYQGATFFFKVDDGQP